MTLLLVHDITFHYRWSQPVSAPSGPAPAPQPWQLPPQETHLCCSANYVLRYTLAQMRTTKQRLLGVPSSLLQNCQTHERISSSVRGAADEPNACWAPPTFPGHLPSTWQGGFAQTYHMTRPGEIECWR